MLSLSDIAIKNFVIMSNSLEISDNEIVSHYTSFSALKGILENLSFRASHVFYMNDPSDGVVLYDSVIDVIKRMLLGTAYSRELENFESDFLNRNVEQKLSDSPLPEFNRNERSDKWMYEICREMIQRKYHISRGRFSGYEDVYVISFVRNSNQDMVNHWMSYGKDGYGVRIDISVKEFMHGVSQYFVPMFGEDVRVGSTIYFGACLYENNDQIYSRAIDFIRSIISSINEDFDSEAHKNIIYKISRAVIEISSIIKHESYKNEDECRLILSSVPIEIDGVGYNVSGSLVQPYRLVGLNWEAIVRLVCGPRADPRSEHATTHLVENLRYKYIQEISDVIKDGRANYWESKWKRFLPPSKELKVVRSLVKYVGKEH